MKKADAQVMSIIIITIVAGFILLVASTGWTKAIGGQSDTVFCKTGIVSKEPNLRECKTRFIEIAPDSVHFYSSKSLTEPYDEVPLPAQEPGRGDEMKKALANAMVECKDTIYDAQKDKYEHECIVCFVVYFHPESSKDISGFHEYLEKTTLKDKTYAQRFYLQPTIPDTVLLPDRLKAREEYEIFILLDNHQRNVVVDMAPAKDILASNLCEKIY